MEQRDRDVEIGRAIDRLIDRVLADDVLRQGLLALAYSVIERAAADRGSSPVVDREPVVTMAPDEGIVATPAGVPAHEADRTPVGPAADRGSVPMDRDLLGQLIDSGLRRLQVEERSRQAATSAASPAQQWAAGGPDDPHDLDVPLPGIRTRCRLRAVVTRSVAERVRVGTAIPEDVIHRARSEGASTWIVDVLSPDPDALDRLAMCLDAVADAADLVILRRRYGLTGLADRREALEWFAAVQSALRIVSRSLRQTPDEDQRAAFDWLARATDADRIFVARHMRLDDPLDPDRVPEVAELVAASLAALKERADRDDAVRKGLQTLRYLANRMREGKGTSLELGKIIQLLNQLVDAGLQPTRLELREVLLPIRGSLRAVGAPGDGYSRVLTALDDHLAAEAARAEERLREEEPGDEARIGSIAEAVRRARTDLDRVQIPDTALTHLEDFIGIPEDANWGRRTWRALRALHAYAGEADDYGGFWDWCARSGRDEAWPASPKTLAMKEGDYAMNARGEQRVFAIDPAVNGASSIVMQAHCKVVEGGGPLIPRIYFHDDTKGATGRVHIGFIGTWRTRPRTECAAPPGELTAPPTIHLVRPDNRNGEGGNPVRDGSGPWMPARRKLIGAGLLAFAVVGGTALPAAAAVPRLLLDIRSGAAGSEPYDFQPLGSSLLLFTADDGVSGRELWKTDGTTAGTRRVRDIQSGAGSSDPSLTSVQMGGFLYFTAETSAHGRELWRTDGTTQGTTRVADIRPGSSGSDPNDLHRMGQRIYFYADDGTNGRELWTTDGTSAGTELVLDINPGPPGSQWCCMDRIGSLLLFRADVTGTGKEPWRSDGTAAGTYPLGDLKPGPGDSYAPESPLRLGGPIVFGTNAEGAWKTDGTVAGTTLLRELADYYYPVRVGTRIVFMGSAASPRDRELWVTDGTPAGTRLLKNIDPVGSSSPRFWGPEPIGGLALFQADDGTNGYELWRSDGTRTGTVLVKDINSTSPGASSSEGTGYNTVVGSRLYFIADDGVHGEEIWRTDGTAAGTRLVRDIRQGSASSDPVIGDGSTIGGVTYFSADLPATGREIWRTDGTRTGTRLVSDLRPGADGSDPYDLIAFGGRLIIAADDGTKGVELWVLNP